MRMYGRRRELSAEETAANAARKAARDKAAMTCQCCASKILANKGVIAHHGYQRPGIGWQTSSCFGARHLPFEVDRETLGLLIKNLKARRVNMVEHRRKIEAEETSIRKSWEVPVRGEDGKVIYWMGRRKTETKHFDTTRANFAELKAIREAAVYGDFDDLKTTYLNSRDFEIKNITDYINECQGRYDGWKQTHTWDAATEVWKPV